MAGLLGGIMGSGGGGGGGAPAIGGIAGATPYGAIANAAVGAMNAMKDGGDLGSTNKVDAKTGGNKNRTKQRFGSTDFGADNSQIKLYIIGGLLVASLILARSKGMI